MNKNARLCRFALQRTIITALLALVSMETFAQQVMLADSINKNPVSYATVYDANGTLIGRSGIGGYIHLLKGFDFDNYESL